MKNILKITLSVSILAALFVWSGCNGSEPPLTETEIVGELLTASTWLEPVVTVDDVDQSDLYKDFSIRFAGDGTYSSVAGDPVWKTNGTWKFKNEAADVLVFDDDLEVTINSISDAELEFQFTWSETTFEENGRAASVRGKNRFRLKR